MVLNARLQTFHETVIRRCCVQIGPLLGRERTRHLPSASVQQQQVAIRMQIRCRKRPGQARSDLHAAQSIPSVSKNVVELTINIPSHGTYARPGKPRLALPYSILKVSSLNHAFAIDMLKTTRGGRSLLSCLFHGTLSFRLSLTAAE